MPPKTSKNTKAPAAAADKKAKRGPPALIQYYLVLFNLVSFFAWVIVFSSVIKHLAFGLQPHSPPVEFASRIMARFRLLKIGYIKSYSYLPGPIATLVERSTTAFGSVGSAVLFAQSLAILEVVHAAVGWVRSPVITTATQVASRIFMTWGVTERYTQAATSPAYAPMVLAWAITECIRYPFYANGLLGADSPGLLWARYTTFYVLYPIGAGSEALCILATIPKNMSQWDVRAWTFAGLFVFWWYGLYVMYSYMLKQRRKTIGKGFWGDKLVQELAAKKQQ